MGAPHLGEVMHVQAYLRSLKEINDDISVAEEDEVLWIPHKKLKNGNYEMIAFILHTGWRLISEIKYASTVTSICVLVTF